ncbi:Protein argonaute-2 [Psilocybe cubensis]|uniref:Protein argonaute-2 n=1 Tax=Psilocybe cubensis TaxID=181762 RepID=A0ACB8H6G7_PSICU|nr:Protein argonaute-2 [Psilocybe cubensis]KAH9483501.1 Protein argonaute-2 [Psilocybe cubensis]
MPPRASSNRGGTHRGGANVPPRGARGGGAGRGGQSSISLPGAAAPSISSHVKTVGVKRPNYGSAGRAMEVYVNSFAVKDVPTGHVFHYDVVEPDKLPARFNMKLFKVLQEQEKNVFEPKISYDGQKNAFAPRELPLGPNDSRKFPVSLPQANGGSKPTRPPKVYHITLTKVAKINLAVLENYLNGQQSHDETVLTAIMALNVVIRMEPNQNNTFNKRSFFIPEGRRPIGKGMELWRGIFQSIRPTFQKLVVNIDLATAVMYREGPLINLCMEYFSADVPNIGPKSFTANVLSEYRRVQLARFISGLSVTVATTGSKMRVIRGLSAEGASTYRFEAREGHSLTVAQYYKSIGMVLQYPDVLCVQLGSSAMVPLELCFVPRGQVMRKQVPADKVNDVLEFSTMRPQERLEQIKKGIRDLQYGQSDYVRDFGMEINPNPMKVQMRVIDPPKLRYGPGSQPIVNPRNGSWNMLDKKFYKPATIARWIVVVYESRNRFRDDVQRFIIKSFLDACKGVGVVVENETPLVKFEHPHGKIQDQLLLAGKECMAKLNGLPTLMVIILPEGAGDIYTAVKHFGDVTVGVATQCLKFSKCARAKSQYWANVLLKVNVKLGGINVIPDPGHPSVAAITDPHNPTIVMGADVIHPSPGSNDRPSFTALVGSVDSNAAKYVPTTRVQTGRQEIIEDLEDMTKEILQLFISYQRGVEKKSGNLKRLIFYRDGVSEGQFKHVLENELPMIQRACAELKLNPKITLIVVGKRHHNQLFPTGPTEDRSGNCPAGSVIDREITHPTDFDFILQSHAGILGTSRPGHYSVLHDEYGFNADSLHALSFALCHVYARSTRSVSIPAPVYYADIVCSRAKNHYDPQGSLRLSETGSQVSGTSGGYLESFKAGFKPLHSNQKRLMYFCVSLNLVLDLK